MVENILLCGCIHLDLSHVGISTVLMIRQRCDLNHKSPDWLAFGVSKGNPNPTSGLPELKKLDLLKIVEVIPNPDGDFIGCVALVGFVVCVDGDAVNCRLAAELDVDEVRLGAVRLPVSFCNFKQEKAESNEGFSLILGGG